MGRTGRQTTNIFEQKETSVMEQYCASGDKFGYLFLLQHLGKDLIYPCDDRSDKSARIKTIHRGHL